MLFKVGKAQIYDILKNKIKIQDEWVKGTAGHAKRITKYKDYDEINRALCSSGSLVRALKEFLFLDH